MEVAVSGGALGAAEKLLRRSSPPSGPMKTCGWLCLASWTRSSRTLKGTRLMVRAEALVLGGPNHNWPAGVSDWFLKPEVRFGYVELFGGDQRWVHPHLGPRPLLSRSATAAEGASPHLNTEVLGVAKDRPRDGQRPQPELLSVRPLWTFLRNWIKSEARSAMARNRGDRITTEPFSLSSCLSPRLFVLC